MRNKLSRLVVLFVCTLFLAACAHRYQGGQQWTREATSQSQIEHDMNHCDWISILLFPFVWGEPCMKGLGYNLEECCASCCDESAEKCRARLPQDTVPEDQEHFYD